MRLMRSAVICPSSLGSSVISAPSASMVLRFSSLKASENTTCSR